MTAARFHSLFFLAVFLFFSVEAWAVSDLGIREISVFPFSPLSGETSTVLVVVKNFGDTASRDFNVGAMLQWQGDAPESIVFNWSDSNFLLPGQEKTFSKTTVFPQNGNWDLVGAVLQGSAPDANTANNVLEGFVNVGAIETDPAVDRVNLEYDSRSGKIQIIAVVNNRSINPRLGTSKGFSQVTVLDVNRVVRAVLDAKPFSALLPGQETAVWGWFFKPPFEGTWIAEAGIFPFNADRNTENNRKQQTITTGMKPDFVAGGFVFRESGQTRFKAVISNSGTASYHGPVLQRAIIARESGGIVQEWQWSDSNQWFGAGTRFEYPLEFGSLPDGSYFFRVFADYFNNAAESSEQNNQSPPYYFSIPDSGSQPNIRFAEPLQIADANGQKKLLVRIMLDGNQSIGGFVNKITGTGPDANSSIFFTVPGLQPGQSYSYFQPLNFPDSRRVISVALDSDNSVPESDESDNQASITVDSNSGTGQADLFIERVFVLYHSLAGNPLRTARVWMVSKNKGTFSAPENRLRIDANSLEGPLAARFLNVPILLPGQSAALQSVFEQTSHLFGIRLFADYYNAVSESDEANNEKKFP